MVCALTGRALNGVDNDDDARGVSGREGAEEGGEEGRRRGAILATVLSKGAIFFVEPFF
jgi:hypothetical protein